MQNSTDWSTKYYSEDAKAKIEERRRCGTRSCRLRSRSNGMRSSPT